MVPTTETSARDGETRTGERLRRQQALIERLQSPACYPHPVDGVALIETHISTLLLAGDFAYKIKKPVRFDFLDYSTLEQRRFFCEEEVKLNRRFAPDLYLDCIAIRGTAEHPVMGGHGEVLEYAVRMRRFAAADQADDLADRAALTSAHMDALAATIAGYHDDAPRQGWERVYGLPHTVTREAIANAEQLLEVIADEADRTGVQHLLEWTRDQGERLQPVLAERLESGFIRECHGDLHLGNLILRDGRWSAFDCVEFDAGLRWIDVMNDLAFTLMDLHARGLPPLAHRLRNRYLTVTGDYAGLAVLRFYLVYRALIRAKVLALSAGAGTDDDQRAAYRQRHRRYLHAANALAHPPSPRLVITHGVSGSGKSWAAQWAADRYGYVWIRSDVERKRLHDLAPGARSHSAAGTGIYSWSATRNTYRRLMELAECALASGWRVILDAAFLGRDQRDEARELARRLRCPFHILALTTPSEVARRRVRARGLSDVSEATEAILDRQLADYQPPSADEQPFVEPAESDAAALRAIFEPWQGPPDDV